MRPLRPERNGDGSEVPQIAERNDAAANGYTPGYTRERELMHVVERLHELLTADELGALARMLAERAEATRD
jgi:hypothetical protein